MPEPTAAAHPPDRDAERTRLRSEVLRQATALLAEGGGKALSARALARAIGMSTKLIYSHFGGMPEIEAGVYALGFAELTRALEAGDDRNRSRVDRLWSVARGYRAFALENPHLFDLMYGPRVRPLAPDAADRGGAAASLDLVARIIAPPDAAPPAVAAVRSLAYTFWSAIHGPISLESSGWLRTNATDVFTDVVGQAVRAAINPPARAHRP